MGNAKDLKDFEQDMIIGVKRPVASISETRNLT